MTEFKQVPSCPTHEVSSCGKVRNIKTGRVLAGSDNKGYKRISIRSHPKGGEYVHRMVAEVYCEGYSPELTVNHIDLDKANNDASNLEWVTLQQNLRSGKITKHSHKYEAIKELHRDGIPQVAIAAQMGMRQGYVSKIVNGYYYGL